MKLFVALPTTHGSMASKFLEGAMDLFALRPCDMEVRQCIDPYIVLGRNAVAADCLQSDCTHLLFIDADILFRAEHVERILSHDVDVVGGFYCKKAEGPIKWVCNALPHRPPLDDRGLLRVRHVGTGFMLINRRVFERMRTEDITYFEDETDRQLWDFFDMPRRKDDKGVMRKLSEDWYFCEKARELGFEVYADWLVRLKHISGVGSVDFPLKTQIAATKQQKEVA